MRRSKFLKSVAIIPFAPLAIPLLKACPFDAQELTREIEAVIEAAVEEIGPSTNHRYAATGEEVISYGWDFLPKYAGRCKHSPYREKHMPISMKFAMNVIVPRAIERGGPNPVTLYWRQKPTITRSPDRPGYWRFMTRFLVSKKEVVGCPVFVDGRLLDKGETIAEALEKIKR